MAHSISIKNCTYWGTLKSCLFDKTRAQVSFYEDADHHIIAKITTQKDQIFLIPQERITHSDGSPVKNIRDVQAVFFSSLRKLLPRPCLHIEKADNNLFLRFTAVPASLSRPPQKDFDIQNAYLRRRENRSSEYDYWLWPKWDRRRTVPRIAEALDLDGQPKVFRPRSTLHPGLDLHPLSMVEHGKKLTGIFATYERFMRDALYDPDIGYYSTGKVAFEDKSQKGDFHTCPDMLSPIFGSHIAEQAFTMRANMIACGDIHPDEPFTILECGAGRGQLAHDALAHIYKMAKTSAEWASFAKAVQYCIVEISPTLQEWQQKKLNPFHDKVKFVKGDARKLKDIFPPRSIKGLIVTNEVPDAFSVHKARICAPKRVEVALVVPYVHIEAIKLLRDHGIKIGSLKEKSDRYREEFPRQLKNIHPATILLSQKDFLHIVKSMGPHWKDTGKWLIGIAELYLSEDRFPDIKAYLDLHEESLAGLPRGAPLVINLGVPQFVEGISSILDKGFATTIDYGENDKEIFANENTRQPRFFPKQAHFYRGQFGLCDITTDIPWTQFSREGDRRGLQRQFFGSQRALQNPLRHIPGMPATPFLDAPLDEGHGCFKMMVQKSSLTKAHYLPAGLPLPLTDTQLLVERLHRSSISRHCNTFSIKSAENYFFAAALFNCYCDNGRKPFPIEHFLKYVDANYSDTLVPIDNIPYFAKNGLELLCIHGQEIFSLIEAHPHFEDFPFEKLAGLFSSEELPDQSEAIAADMIKCLIWFHQLRAKQSAILT